MAMATSLGRLLVICAVAHSKGINMEMTITSYDQVGHSIQVKYSSGDEELVMSFDLPPTCVNEQEIQAYAASYFPVRHFEKRAAIKAMNPSDDEKPAMSIIGVAVQVTETDTLAAKRPARVSQTLATRPSAHVMDIL